MQPALLSCKVCKQGGAMTSVLSGTLFLVWFQYSEVILMCSQGVDPSYECVGYWVPRLSSCVQAHDLVTGSLGHRRNAWQIFCICRGLPLSSRNLVLLPQCSETPLCDYSQLRTVRSSVLTTEEQRTITPTQLRDPTGGSYTNSFEVVFLRKVQGRMR